MSQQTRLQQTAPQQTGSQQTGMFDQRLADARALGEACDGLARRSPDLSARGGLSPGQRAGGWGLLGALAALAWLMPATLPTLGALAASALFSLIIAARIAAVFVAGLARSESPDVHLNNDASPTLTILIPLYREARVAAGLIGALAALDYPSSLREVKLLVEADDDETLSTLLVTPLPDGFEIIPVPPALPRTKPKALNYGLATARGDIVAVFDAEDLPSPDQPRAAMAAFAAGDDDLFAVQAPLAIHNGDDGWMQRQFEIEYAIHFRVWLPFLARLGAPLPLGGTSNYFRRDKLIAVGGWDAWNVTEDADLGMRIARRGGRVGMIAPLTLEEAPARFGDWLGQRTRWMKGHVQTWLVLNRNPFKAIGQMGLGAFLAAQISLGASLLASAIHAPLMIWLLLGLLTPYVSLDGWYAALFGLGYGSVVAAAFAARLPRRALPALLLLPLYWPIVTLAMICALWDLKARPHFWAKTPHGIGRHAG